MDLRNSNSRCLDASDADRFMQRGADSLIVQADAGTASAFLFIVVRVRLLANIIFLLRGILGVGIAPTAAPEGIRP
jgi:hypothetical protein